jgi:hypothetical protein
MPGPLRRLLRPPVLASASDRGGLVGRMAACLPPRRNRHAFSSFFLGHPAFDHIGEEAFVIPVGSCKGPGVLEGPGLLHSEDSGCAGGRRCGADWRYYPRYTR